MAERGSRGWPEKASLLRPPTAYSQVDEQDGQGGPTHWTADGGNRPRTRSAGEEAGREPQLRGRTVEELLDINGLSVHVSRCMSTPLLDSATNWPRSTRDQSPSGHAAFPARRGVRVPGYTWKLANKDERLRRESSDEIQAFRLLSRMGLQGGARTQQHKLSIHRIHWMRSLFSLYLQDLFHTLVNLKIRFLLLLFGLVYIVAFSIVAYCFWMINERCNLGMDNFEEAFVFAVETWLTIGYGVKDPPGPYLRQCPPGVVIVTLQGLCGLIMNAVLVGIVITHVSSGALRGCTVIFSEKAVVREVAGRIFLLIQMCEMRSTQLLEVHARLYLVRRPVCSTEVPVAAPTAFEMRLLRPDDATGALMLPVLPSQVVHEIDANSPLAPPASRDDPLRSRHWTRPSLRAVDADCGDRDGVWCKTCGEQFGTLAMLQAHTRYMAEQDALNGTVRHPHVMPDEDVQDQRNDASRSSLASASVDELPGTVDGASWRSAVRDFMDQEWFEILCVLEGVDTTTASTVQARHSYVKEDLAWDYTFAPMFSVNSKEGAHQGACIDFTKINDLVPAPPEELVG